MGEPPGLARCRAAPPRAEKYPLRGYEELAEVHGCTVPFPPPPSTLRDDAQGTFPVNHGEIRDGSLSESPLPPRPVAAAPRVEAPGRGRQDAEDQAREPRAGPGIARLASVT